MRVMIVDDEPVYLKEIKRLLLKYSERNTMPIDIIGTYYNGEQAAEALELENVDLIITDIRMACMDGLELAKRIRLKRTDCQVVIISGYSDFNYAREAMRVDVAEYLLKPIDPNEFYATMNLLTERINGQILMKRKDLLFRYIQGEHSTNLEHMEEINLQNDNLFGMMVIQNPNIYYGGLLPNDQELELLLLQLTRDILQQNEIWIYRSGGAREYIVLFSKIDLDDSTFQSLSQHISHSVSDSMVSVSVAYSKSWSTIHQLKDKFAHLKRLLNQYVTIGYAQSVCLEDENPNHTSQFGSYFFQTIQETKISEWIKKQKWETLNQEIEALMQYWNTEKCPSYRIKQYLTQLCHLIAKVMYTPEDNPMERNHIELRIEEIIYTAASFDEAFHAYWNLIEGVFDLAEQAEYRRKEDHLHAKISEYLMEHISETITLKRLTNEFYISRTALCNVFREQAGCSFVEYLTNLRIDRAKVLIRDSADLMIKEIAQEVGYLDHHYFSRVFRTVTGFTPTEYRTQSSSY